MGNCQAAEVAAAVVHHPDGRSERLHWPTTASQLMAASPGHYVAVIVVVASSRNSNKHVRYLKLLRPDDDLLVGQVYRLVSFEGPEILEGVYDFAPWLLERVLI